ncbi:MAG: hypothetical protein DYG99_12110 [Bacteroidetes bacterium CHB5]|nr:hypothetical protein [Bacteroidetes bacterium CHB5]
MKIVKVHQLALLGRASLPLSKPAQKMSLVGYLKKLQTWLFFNSWFANTLRHCSENFNAHRIKL